MNPTYGNSPYTQGYVTPSHSYAAADRMPRKEREVSASTSSVAGPRQSINVNELLTLKLQDPERKLDFEESIALMTDCIKRGEMQAY